MIHQCKKVEKIKRKEKLCNCVGGKMIDCNLVPFASNLDQRLNSETGIKK